MTARERLDHWIHRSKLSQREAAAAMGVHWTVLNKILKGHRHPGLAIAHKIEDATGITTEAWLSTQDGIR